MAQVPTVPDYNPSTPEDTPLNGQVVGTDADLDTLTYSLGAQATHGVAVVQADGNWTYTPVLNYNGADQFTVIVNDNVDGTATSTINVTVTAVNDAPVNTVPGAQSTAEDTPLAFTAAKLITVNDVDGNLATTRVTVTNGTLNVSLAGGATISAGANSSATLTLSGTQVQINAALATLVYTPTLNYNGAALLTVLSTDAAGTPLTDSDTVAITVTAVNDAPVNTVPGAQSTAEDTVLVFNGAKLITVNDVDGNLATTQLTVTNGILNVTLGGGATISAGANGTATLTLAGTQTQINAALATLTYTPTLNYNGAALLTVVSGDGTASDTDTVAITVTAVNDAPVNTVPGAQSTAEDTVLVFNGAKLITVNDVDGNLATTRVTVTNGVLNVSLAGGATISAGANNSATLTLSGTQVQINAALATLTYTPTANFNGSALLTVLSTDAGGTPLTDTDTVAITVTAVNDAPTVPNYNKSVEQDAVLSDAVVGADVDAGAVLTYALGAQATHGVAVVAADGTYTYTPTAAYVGADSFTVTVSDGTLSATSTISVTVSPLNVAPVVPNYSLSTPEDTVLNGAVVATDANVGDTLTYTKGTGPSHGTAVVTSGTGAFVYTPAANYFGPDEFTVVVSDGALSATSTVSINVTEVNDPPVIPNYTPTVVQDHVLNGKVTATDPDSTSLIYTQGAAPAHGTLYVNQSGDYVYTPTPGYSGSDTFAIVVSDGKGGTATSTVTVTVTAVKVPLEATDYSGITPAGQALVVPAATLKAETFGGKAPVNVTSVQAPVNGTVALAGGNVTFTPKANFDGAASFTYTATDADGDVATAKVNVTISPAPLPDLAAVKTKLDASGDLSLIEFQVLQAAAEDKYKDALAALNLLTGGTDVAQDPPYCRTPAEVLTRMAGLISMLSSIQRQTDEANKVASAAQVTKMKDLVTQLDL